MHVIYTTRTSGFENGKHYRNPEYFERIEPRAESVSIEGNYPAIKAAYEKADVKVDVKQKAARSTQKVQTTHPSPTETTKE